MQALCKNTGQDVTQSISQLTVKNANFNHNLKRDLLKHRAAIITFSHFSKSESIILLSVGGSYTHSRLVKSVSKLMFQDSPLETRIEMS